MVSSKATKSSIMMNDERSMVGNASTTTTTTNTDITSTISTTNYHRFDPPNDDRIEVVEYDNMDNNTRFTRCNYMSTSIRDTMSSHTHPIGEEDRQRIQYLALRKFHIPGHTFTQDYIYWYVSMCTCNCMYICMSMNFA
jgi:hypothetical protein